MPRRARGQPVALEHEHVGDPEVGQVVGDRGADDPTADDDHPRPLRQGPRGGPIRRPGPVDGEAGVVGCAGVEARLLTPRTYRMPGIPWTRSPPPCGSRPRGTRREEATRRRPGAYASACCLPWTAASGAVDDLAAPSPGLGTLGGCRRRSSPSLPPGPLSLGAARRLGLSDHELAPAPAAASDAVGAEPQRPHDDQGARGRLRPRTARGLRVLPRHGRPALGTSARP